MYKFLKVFTLLILFFSCKHTETYEGKSDDEVIVAFDKVKQKSIKRDISYLPRWQDRIEFEGSYYIPLNTDKRIYSFTSDSVKYSLIGRIWLKANKQGDVWNFTKLTVLPNDIRNSKGSGLFIYEDWQTGELSYDGYIEKRLFRAVRYEQEIRRVNDKIDKKAQNSPVGVICRIVTNEVCAGSGRDLSCMIRTETICTSTTIPGGGNGGNTNPPPVGNGGHGGGSGGGNNTPPIIVDDVNYEQLAIDVFNESIDDTNLPDCMKGVLDTLKMLSGNTVANIVQKFAGELSGYKLKFAQELKDGEEGLTQVAWVNNEIKEGYVTINFNTYRDVLQNVTDVAAATTILHESVHAYLYAYYKDDPASATANYPELFKKYIFKKSGINSSPTQHNEMAKTFINDIAASLVQYGKKMKYPMNESFYKDLAWKGLTDTDAFKSLSDTDKKRITDIIKAEQYGIQNVAPKEKKLGC